MVGRAVRDVGLVVRLRSDMMRPALKMVVVVKCSLVGGLLGVVTGCGRRWQ